MERKQLLELAGVALVVAIVTTTYSTCLQRSLRSTCCEPTPAPSPTPSPTPTPSTLYTEAKKVWESKMLEKGRASCERIKTARDAYLAGTGAVDPCMSYYDGEEVFYKIFKYTGDPYWKDCSQAVEQCYRGAPPGMSPPNVSAPHGYIYGNNGATSGYWNFSSGIRFDYDETQDPDSKQAVILISKKASYAGSTGSALTSAYMSRENAYAMRGYINSEALGEPHVTRYDDMVTWAYGYIDPQWVGGTYRLPSSDNNVPAARGQYYIQPFMFGLLMRSLIMRFEASGDPNVYPNVKKLVEFMNQIAWNETDAAWFYEDYAVDMPTLMAKQPRKVGAPDLNMLIAPALAWLYTQDGDQKWFEIGDKAFDAGARKAYIDQDKQFNQNYCWSFEYVKWRESHPVRKH